MSLKFSSKVLVIVTMMALIFASMPGVSTDAAAKVKISKCTIKLSKTTFTYTGKQIKPKVTVKYKKKTLKNGKNYKLSYKNNKNPGTATVVIKGIGTYKGSVKKTFKIKKKSTSPMVDGDNHILTQTIEENIPKLTVVGDKWPCDEATLQEAWKKYYSYMVQILGPVADDFFTQGLTWKMTEETLAHHCNEQFPSTNTIEMGIQVASQDTNQCIAGLVHETGHMWLQYNNEAISFDHGQWIWEAVTNLVERILISEGIGDGAMAVPFDMYDYLGWDVLNGTVTDGQKAHRAWADYTGSCALYYMDTVLSTPGTYDYWVKVNKLRNETAVSTNSGITTKEQMQTILDEAAAGKTIDGLKPSEWLYTRSVSNIEGKDGNYLTVVGNYGDNFGHDMRYSVYGYKRVSGTETGYNNQTVSVKLYNAKNKLVGSSNTVLNDNGSAEKQNILSSAGKEIMADDLDAFSAVRYEATAETPDGKLNGTNYSVALAKDNKVTNNDNRIFIILTDKDGKLVSNLASNDISVTGASKIDKSHLKYALLIAEVDANKTITVTTSAGTYTISKPTGARMITVMC